MLKESLTRRLGLAVRVVVTITDVSTKTVTKKYKAASFAAGCDRSRIAMSDVLLPRERMYEIAIAEITAIKDELGLC